MTVQFKANLTGVNPVYVSFDEMLQGIAEAPKKQMVSPLYITRIYTTTSDKKPLKWQAFDHTASTNNDSDFLKQSLEEWIDYCNKLNGYTGYKIVTMAVDHLKGVSQVMPGYCKEHWQVKEKVYINGPKKKPFPAKAAKHY